MDEKQILTAVHINMQSQTMHTLPESYSFLAAISQMMSLPVIRNWLPLFFAFVLMALARRECIVPHTVYRQGGDDLLSEI